MVAINPAELIARVRQAPSVKFRGLPLGIVSSFCVGSSIKSAGRGRVMIEAPFTTDDVDMDNEVVLPAGVDVDTYLRPVGNVFVDHKYDILRRVGSIRSITRTPNGWTMLTVLVDDNENPYVRAVKSMAEDGKAPVSMGYEEEEAGPPTSQERQRYPGIARMVRKSMALEVSFTAIPCNVDCQGAIFMGSEKAREVRELCIKSMERAKIPRDVLELFVPPEPKRRRRVVLCG